MVRYIEDMNEFTQLTTGSGSGSSCKLVVVDFTASWCGPCQYIGPIFEQLSKENTDVEFVKVDVDDADDISAACNIQAMPTFQFYKNGSKIDELQGADVEGLKSLIAKHK